MSTIHTAHCKRKGTYSVYAYWIPEGYDFATGFTIRSSDSLEEATQEALTDITGRHPEDYQVIDHGKRPALFCEYYKF